MTPEDEHNRTQAEIDAMRASQTCKPCGHPRSAHGFGGCCETDCECLLHHVPIPQFNPPRDLIRETLLDLDQHYRAAYLLLPEFHATIDAITTTLPDTLREAFELAQRLQRDRVVKLAEMITRPATFDVNAITNAAAEVVLMDQQQRVSLRGRVCACRHEAGDHEGNDGDERLCQIDGCTCQRFIDPTWRCECGHTRAMHVGDGTNHPWCGAVTTVPGGCDCVAFTLEARS